MTELINPDLRIYDIDNLSLNDPYPDVLKSYVSGEFPEERRDSLMNNPEKKKAREQMLRNVIRLDNKLSDPEAIKENKTISFDKQLKEIITNIAKDSARLLPEDEKVKTLEFIDGLENQGQLFSHLDEASGSTFAFFEGSADCINDEVGAESGLFTRHETILIEFAAATHDLAKLLGGMNAQIDPDHEAIYKEIIGKHLEGKMYISRSGEKIVFSAADVAFITSLVGLHEDIFREEGFSKQADSLKNTRESVSSEVKVSRARTILHFIDIFGDAVRFDKGELKIVDEAAFKIRFIDLFRRHISLPIINNEDPENQVNYAKGKVFRPKWGLHGVAGLTWTFGLLKSEWGINVDPSLIDSVQEGIVKVLKESEAAIEGVQKGEKNFVFVYKKDIKERAEEQIEIDEEITVKLLEIKRTIASLEAEISVDRKK